MHGLSGVLPATKLDLVKRLTSLRFDNPLSFKTPEALIIYEQHMMEEEKLLAMCSKEYGVELSTPSYAYIPKELTDEFRGKSCVPIRYDTRNKVIYVGILPELEEFIPDVRHIRVEKVKVPIYYYVQLHVRHFGLPKFLKQLPIKDKVDLIVEEAVNLQASDITITTVASGANVYYNCRKKKVPSRRVLEEADVEEIAKYLAAEAQSPIVEKGPTPKYLSVKLDMHNRGRVVLNKTHYGRAITIRVLPDDVLTLSLEELNIANSTCNFIRDIMLSSEKGLRLFIGETMSGKNTTILSALSELVARDTLKIVSLENPVEILVDGVEQISVETEEEYAKCAASLLRQNPDIVYVAEITNYTAVDTVNTSNTGKVVFSSIHANSISDVIARLQDITGMSSDRLLLSMHSCVYQELVRDEEKDQVFPKNRCLYFSDELKERLYGKSLGEIKVELAKEEAKWL